MTPASLLSTYKGKLADVEADINRLSAEIQQELPKVEGAAYPDRWAALLSLTFERQVLMDDMKDIARIR